MEIDKPKVEQHESDGEGSSSPPRKKSKNHTFDPIKHLLGKAQTFLNKDFIFYYKVRWSSHFKPLPRLRKCEFSQFYGGLLTDGY